MTRVLAATLSALLAACTLVVVLPQPVKAARSQPGSASYSATTTTPPVTSPAFTVSLWFRAGSATSQTLWAANSGADTDYWALQYRGDAVGTEVVGWLADHVGAVAAAYTTAYAPPSNLWHHVACVEAAAASRAVYLDGAGKGTDTTAISPAGLTRCTVGTFRGASNAFPVDGAVAKVAVFDVALTDAEIASLAAHANPRKIRPGHCVSYLPLDGDATGERDEVTGTVWSVSNATKAGAPPGLVRGGVR